MESVQQEVMCVLLQLLADRGLIAQQLCDRARERVLSTPDWPEFFRAAEAEGSHGAP